MLFLSRADGAFHSLQTERDYEALEGYVQVCSCWSQPRRYTLYNQQDYPKKPNCDTMVLE